MAPPKDELDPSTRTIRRISIPKRTTITTSLVDLAMIISVLLATLALLGLAITEDEEKTACGLISLIFIISCLICVIIKLEARITVLEDRLK